MTKCSTLWIYSGSDHELTDDSEMRVLAPDLIGIIESSILTFHLFMKRDKKKSSGATNQNQLDTPLQQIQSTLEKVNLKPFSCVRLQFYDIPWLR